MTDEHDQQAQPPEPAASELLPEGEEREPPGARAMAIVRWSLVALMTAAAAASLAHHFGLLGTAAEQQARVQYYCPMHPQIVQDRPGECPICNMTLVPRTASPSAAATRDGHAPHASVPSSGGEDGGVPGLAPIQLPPERVQLMGMRTAQVTRRPLASELRATGVVTTREQGMARVHTRFAGWIERLAVAETGARVERGQVLATVYSPELLAVQHELINARKWAAPSPAPAKPAAPAPAMPLADLADQARTRLRLLGISDAEIAQIESSGQPSNALPLRSPVSGYVTRKNAVQGMYVEPGTELFEIADLSRVWVVVDVPEQEMARIARSARARLVLSALPEKSFAGELQFIYPTLDPDTRALRVRLEFKNHALELRPGMFGEVWIESSSADSLAVPAEAVVDTGTVRYVFLALQGGVFAPRRVRTGAQSDGFVQVLQGVQEGDVVVTSANFLLDSESRLHTTQAAAGAEAAPAPAAPAAPRSQGRH